MIGPKAPKPDSLDERLLRAMIESAPFQQLRKRQESELARALSTCERSDIPVELYRAQGAAAALRAVLMLPELMLREMERNGL